MNNTNSILNLPYDIDDWTLKMLKQGYMVLHVYKGDGLYLVRKDCHYAFPEEIEDEFVVDGLKILVLNSI